jgi:hypothetical protein
MDGNMVKTGPEIPSVLTLSFPKGGGIQTTKVIGKTLQ